MLSLNEAAQGHDAVPCVLADAPSVALLAPASCAVVLTLASPLHCLQCYAAASPILSQEFNSQAFIETVTGVTSILALRTRGIKKLNFLFCETKKTLFFKKPCSSESTEAHHLLFL